jgi:glycosyltransferase involved in cell wall biosynthesis
MRIFIGFTDVANITATYASAFRALGHETFSVVWSKSKFYPDSQYDAVIYEPSRPGTRANFVNGIRMMWQMAQLTRVLACDLCLMFAPAMLPSHLYYPILKYTGKKIVTAFWGSDIRYWYAFDKEMQELDLAEEFAPFIRYARERSGGSYFDKLRTIRTAEQYSDLILSQPDCAQLQQRPYMRTYLPIDLSKFKCDIPDREIPLILHAPSVSGAKGTDHVLAAVDELRQEGIRFDFQFIENMPNAQLRKLLTQADIVVDELYSLTVGGMSAEAMASGCAVLVRYDTEFSHVPPGCPAMNTSVNTLADNLREVILNREQRRQLAVAGRQYVTKHNDHIKIAQQILDWLKPGAITKYDFTPTFSKRFTMPPELIQEERAETWSRRKQLFNSILRTGETPKH